MVSRNISLSDSYTSDHCYLPSLYAPFIGDSYVETLVLRLPCLISTSFASRTNKMKADPDTSAMMTERCGITALTYFLLPLYSGNEVWEESEFNY